MNLSLVLPKDSIPLEPHDFEKLKQACEWIEHLLSIRDEYILKNNLDLVINNPAAGWSKGCRQFVMFRAVMSKDYDILNMLRVFSQSFTGNFLGVKFAQDLPDHINVPENLNDIVLKYLINKNEIDLFYRYDQIMKIYPELKYLALPKQFGESGYQIGSQIVNNDLFVYLERIALLMKSGLMHKLRMKQNPIILEIGSGFGGLAYLIKKLIPNCVYICVDLPESLVFSASYLSRNHEKCYFFNENSNAIDCIGNDFVFIPNFMFHKLISSNDLKIDLAINTLSMSEMAKCQVEYYSEGLIKILDKYGYFFEQNQDNKHLTNLCYAKEIIGQYFQAKFDLTLDIIDLTQGAATLWCN